MLFYFKATIERHSDVPVIFAYVFVSSSSTFFIPYLVYFYDGRVEHTEYFVYMPAGSLFFGTWHRLFFEYSRRSLVDPK